MRKRSCFERSVTALSFGLIAMAHPSPASSAEAVQDDSAVASAENRTDGEAASFLERLYALIWPGGRFQGDLDQIVSRSTQKSNVPIGLGRMYLVHYREGVIAEIEEARGGLEPAFCARQGLLLLRRRDHLERLRLDVSAPGGAVAAGPSRPIEGVEVSRLYACTNEPEHGAVAWVDDSAGRTRRLAVEGEARWLGEVEGPGDAARRRAVHAARVLQGVRPDGVAVRVSDRRLVGSRSRDERWLIASSPFSFFGFPVWLGSSDLLVVMATEVRGR